MAAGAALRRTEAEAAAAQNDVKLQIDVRLNDIRTWTAALEKSKGQVHVEIGRLIVTVDELESNIQFVGTVPIDTARQCLQLRAQRQGIDLVRDAVELQLERELEVVAEVQARLNANLEDAKQQQARLSDVARRLDADLEDKSTAETLDVTTRTLDTSANTLRLSRDTLRRSPTRAVQPEDWKQFSTQNIQAADVEVRASAELGNRVHAALEATAAALRAQRDAVDRAFQGRLSEVQSHERKNQQEIAKTRNEMISQEDVIRALEVAIRAKDRPLELATTRLATRTGRPNVELVADGAHHSLINEAQVLDNSVYDLNTQLYAAQSSLQSLEDQLDELLTDSQVKQKSISVESQAISRRDLAADRKPRVTEYYNPRGTNEWQSLGRSRCLYM